MTDADVPGTEEEGLRVSIIRSMKMTQREEEEMEDLLNQLRILLEQRPVWIKSSIETEFSTKGIKYSSDFTLKKALSTLTYLFKNGPWKFTYIKFGYDPRKDKKSFIHQTFNVGMGNRNFLMDTKQEG